LPFSGIQKPPLHFVLCHDNPENVVQERLEDIRLLEACSSIGTSHPQKRPAGMNIKSNFFFDLIGYFREISDIKRDKSAGEHQRSVEDKFDGEKGETEPVLGLFEGNTTGPLI
jgi:hypothetical protein